MPGLLRWSRPGANAPGLALILAILAASSVSAVWAEQLRADTLDEAAERYRVYMIKDIDQSLAGARLLRDRIGARDLDGAQKAWIAARIGWERAEVFTSGFVPDLDREIDAWPNATMGFHAIEAKLFGAGHTDVEDQADALIFHLADLDVKVHLMQLPPQRLLNGTARLAYEIGESKANGGESRFSGTSLADMRNNAEGIELAYRTIFAPALEARDPALASSVAGKIERLKALIGAVDLKDVDPEALRATSEELILALQRSAPQIGLRSPSLEELTQ